MGGVLSTRSLSRQPVFKLASLLYPTIAGKSKCKSCSFPEQWRSSKSSQWQSSLSSSWSQIFISFLRHDCNHLTHNKPLSRQISVRKKQANSLKIAKLSSAVTHKPVVECGRTKLQKHRGWSVGWDGVGVYNLHVCRHLFANRKLSTATTWIGWVLNRRVYCEVIRRLESLLSTNLRHNHRNACLYLIVRAWRTPFLIVQWLLGLLRDKVLIKYAESANPPGIIKTAVKFRVVFVWLTKSN